MSNCVPLDVFKKFSVTPLDILGFIIITIIIYMRVCARAPDYPEKLIAHVENLHSPYICLQSLLAFDYVPSTTL